MQNSGDEDTYFQVKNTLNCRGRILDLSTPKVMGILNLTPDSFHDGGRYLLEKEYLSRAEKMLDEGAALIDIGGQSTRPGAAHLGPEEEWSRLETPLSLLVKYFPESIFSIDTFHASVASKACDLGISMVNDVSGGTMDPDMFPVIAKLNVPYVLMHIQGIPRTMQSKPTYTNVVKEVLDFFSQRIHHLNALGLKDIILDPGFGFGKTLEHNYTLLKNLGSFRMTGYPVLAGLSRKSMVTKLLDVAPEDAMNGTTVLNTIALLKGTSLLRVHDVKAAIETIRITNTYLDV